jgi:hypothetical protein
MRTDRNVTAMTGALALLFAAATPPLILPLTPAQAQGYSPMPPACQAASQAAEAEGSRYGQPPANAPVIAQMQHILWSLGLLLDSLDRSCRDWADYGRTRQQFQNSYDGTMQTCLSMASSSSECRRQPYGG